MAARKQRPVSPLAFSLVEVALALGVISAMAIPLLALLVSGFQTIKASNAEVRSAMIAQKIIASAQMLSYAELADADYTLDYEGGRGVPLQEAAFRVGLQVFKQPQGNIFSSKNMARVSVTITGPALNNEKRVFSGIIANPGH